MRRPDVRLTEDQLLEHLQQKLTNLEGLCRLYDEGNPYIAFTMATEIRAILTENAAAVRARGALRFPTFSDYPDSRRNLMAEVKLLSMRFYTRQVGDVARGSLSFLPTILQPDGRRSERLPFREWWNRDIIYRAGAAPIGSLPGYLPPPGEGIPFEDREKLTRRELIDLVRNKFGAHLDQEIPDVLDRLQRTNPIGIQLAVRPAENGETAQGVAEVVIGAAAAMIRSIGEEVLVAYGRRGQPTI